MIGYIGTDFFSYRMMVGSILTAPVTIAITILDPANASAMNDEANNAKKGKKNKKKKATDDERDIEQGSLSPAGDNSYSMIGGKKSPDKKSNRNRYDEVDVEMVDYEESKQANKKGSMFGSSMTKKNNRNHDENEDI